MIVIWGDFFALEVKAVTKPHKDPNALVLSHSFSSIQIATLKQINAAGGIAFGVVKLYDTPLVVVLHPNDIPSSGNFCHYQIGNVGRTYTKSKDNLWEITTWKRNPLRGS